MGCLYHTLSSKARGSLWKRWQKNVCEPEEVDDLKETKFSRQRRVSVQMSSALVTAWARLACAQARQNSSIEEGGWI